MSMGINYIDHSRKVWLRKYRWLIRTSATGGTFGSTEPALFYEPRNLSLCHIFGRPKMNFEEQEIKHTQETIFYHSRPTWEPIEMQLYCAAGDNSVYQWLLKHYNPENGQWGYRDEAVCDIILHMFNGVGQEIERWELDQCHASMIDWGELDYASTEFATCSITLRYARARNTISVNRFGVGSPRGADLQLSGLPQQTNTESNNTSNTHQQERTFIPET